MSLWKRRKNLHKNRYVNVVAPKERERDGDFWIQLNFRQSRDEKNFNSKHTRSDRKEKKKMLKTPRRRERKNYHFADHWPWQQLGFLHWVGRLSVLKQVFNFLQRFSFRLGQRQMNKYCAEQGDESVEEKNPTVAHWSQHRRIRLYDYEWHEISKAHSNSSC